MERTDFEHIIKEKLQAFSATVSSALWWRLFWRMNRSAITGGLFILAVLITGGSILINSFKSAEKTASSESSAAKTTIESSEFRKIKEAEKSEIPILPTTYKETALTAKTPEIAVKKKPAAKTLEITSTRKTTSDINLSEAVSGRKEQFTTELSLLNSQILYKDERIISERNNDSISYDYFLKPDDRISAFAVSIEAGPSYSFSNYNGAANFNDFIDNRIDNESPLPGITPGIRLNYRYKNFNFRTGADYSVFGEKLDYNINREIYDPDASYYRQDTTWGYIYNYPYIEPVVIGVDSAFVEMFKNVKEVQNNRNEYRYLEIPVMAGYVFEKRKLSIMPHAGLSIGLLHQTKGKIRTSLTEDFRNIDKSIANTIITSFVFEMDIAWELKPNHCIFIKPFYKSVLSDIVKKYPVNIRYSYTGIKFGYTISF